MPFPHLAIDFAYIIRGHLAEYGHVAPKGVFYVERLIDQIDSLPGAAQPALRALVQAMRMLDQQVAELDREIALRANKDETARRLTMITTELDPDARLEKRTLPLAC